MARQVNRLTAVKVRALNKPGLHADGNGLYLSVSKTGSKAWVLIYKWRGKRTELGLGSLHAVTLAQARERAREAASLRAQGIDPKQQWRSAAPFDVATFGAVATEFIDDQKAGWRNAKHRQQWHNTLATYCSPIWGKPVEQIDVEDMLTILRPIWRSKAETASRVRQRIERVLDAAKVRGLRTGENPAAWRGNLALLLPKLSKGPKRHQPALPFEHVPTFYTDLRDANGLAARALELVIHTAAKTSEVLNARWSEIDLVNKMWTVPAERMKAGKEHRVPLTDDVITLLKSLSRQPGFVFPGSKANKPLSNMAMLKVLERMDMRDRCTVHGFRSSFRDWAGDKTDFPREIAEQALAHQIESKSERAYRRGDALERRRELMIAWSDYISGRMVEDEPPSTTDPNATPNPVAECT